VLSGAQHTAGPGLFETAFCMRHARSGNTVLIIAGEASGDMHGASLVRALKKKRPDLVFCGIGGDRMSEAGVRLVRHVSEMAFLGFFEVVKHLPFISGVLAEVRNLMESLNPKLLILIDYPGFNLKIAKEAKKRGIPVVYYISPQVWAWGKGRVKKIAKRVDLMLVIFDFEEPIYKKAGMDVAFVGHPLKDAVRPAVSRNDFFRGAGLDPRRPLLGLLPGSRKQEVRLLLPEMVKAFGLLRRDIPGLQAVVAVAPTLSDQVLSACLSEAEGIRPVRERTYEAMAYSDAALVASGTATLETALSGTPMLILYKMSSGSFFLGKLLVRMENIGLVNIVAGKRIVPELLQKNVTPEKIRDAALPLLTDPELRKEIIGNLKTVSRRLGRSGATERAADRIVEFLSSGCGR
jgi:lipid-A-disaccharide synthase